MRGGGREEGRKDWISHTTAPNLQRPLICTCWEIQRGNCASNSTFAERRGTSCRTTASEMLDGFLSPSISPSSDAVATDCSAGPAARLRICTGNFDGEVVK